MPVPGGTREKSIIMAAIIHETAAGLPAYR
jgi:hypothetical protein